MPTTRGKLLVLSLSTAVSVAIGWAVWNARGPDPDSVRTVDTGDDLERLMIERQGSAPDAPSGVSYDPASGAYPPPLVREPVPEDVAARFFPSIAESKQWIYDPQQYARHIGNMRSKLRPFREHPNQGYFVWTNSLGMRENTDPSPQQPDLRILATGDSHTDGVCANAETFPNVLEALLAADHPGRSIEGLNAGGGGYNLYNYVGTFERFASLRPDVFVIAVYGGNDFSGAVVMRRYFERLPPIAREPYRWSSDTLVGGLKSIGNQEFVQETYFANNPGDVQHAIDLACSISVELERLCSAAGCKLVFVHLPPPTRGQPELFAEAAAEASRVIGLPHAQLDACERIADGWLRFLAERGIDFVDLRPEFRSSSELLYWRTDHHLNVAGHRRVAEILRAKLGWVLGD